MKGAETGLQLSEEELGRLYPFFVVIDNADRIIAHGPALTRLCPGLGAGDPVLKHLASVRQSTRLRFADLRSSPPELLVVQTLPTGYALRGTVVVRADCVLFLASPWFRTLEELSLAGLSLSDLAPHDPLVDFLATLQDRDIALADANALAQRLQATRANLQQSLDENLAFRTRLQALVAEVPWGVLVEDEAGRVTLANQSFCELFHVTAGPDSLIGEDCARLATLAAPAFKDPVEFQASIARCVAAQEPRLREIIELVDGRVLERDFIPIGGNGRPLSRMWQYRDVTEARRAERELEEARRRAEAASRAKDDFLAMMSHEMRTPLAVIVGLSELLQGDIPIQAQQDFLHRLEVNARSLMKLIEGTLDLARLGNSDLDLDHKPFDPWAVIDEVAISLSANAASHGLGLEIAVEAGTPERVVGDEHRLRQILVNLVGNSIKFTERGEIRLSLAPGPSGQGLRFSVADTGRGIPAEMLDAIFENFVRVGDERAGRGKGTGLGLPICRRIARAMGGTLVVESAVGVGSLFHLDVPLEAVKVEEHFPPIALDIALVTDRAELRDTIALLLHSLGATLVPEDASPAAADVVLVDGALGTSAVHGSIAEVPRASLVWLPAMGQVTPTWRDLEVADYPMTRADLGRRLRRRAAVASESSAPGACSTGVCRTLRILLVDDDDDGRSVMAMLLERRSHDIVTAPDATVAMRLLHDGDFDLILTDFRMPGMSGIELVRRIRRGELGEAAARTPAVVISADAIHERRLAALDVGAEAFLAKPLAGEQLDATLRGLFDLRLRALIVDDAPDVRMLVRYHLERTGVISVIEAETGAEAMRIVKARGCDVVLLDLGLPDIEGQDVVRAIRGAARQRSLPVLVVSGRDDEETRRASIEAGAAGYLVKPVGSEELLRALREVVAGPRAANASNLVRRPV